MTELGKRIRDLRKAAGLTQEVLCAEAGFSKKVIQDIESGTGNPTIESLNAIAEVLGLQITTLFEDTTTETKAQLILDIQTRLHSLDEIELKALLSSARNMPSQRPNSKRVAR